MQDMTVFQKMPKSNFQKEFSISKTKSLYCLKTRNNSLEAYFMTLSIFETLNSLKPFPFFMNCQSLYSHNKNLPQVC